MEKKYLAQIIATDNEGLQMISACSAGSKVKVSNIKYLASNKVFLLSILRNKIETNQKNDFNCFTLFLINLFTKSYMFGPALLCMESG